MVNFFMWLVVSFAVTSMGFLGTVKFLFKAMLALIGILLLGIILLYAWQFNWGEPISQWSWGKVFTESFWEFVAGVSAVIISAFIAWHIHNVKQEPEKTFLEEIKEELSELEDSASSSEIDQQEKDRLFFLRKEVARVEAGNRPTVS